MDYVTCDRRKNSPQINVLICEKKCKHLNTCSTYLNYTKMKSITAVISGCDSGTDELLVVQDAHRPTLPTAAGK